LSTLPSAIPPSQIGETRTEKKEQILLQGKKIVFSPKGVFYMTISAGNVTPSSKFVLDGVTFPAETVILNPGENLPNERGRQREQMDAHRVLVPARV
jgi:hypothetical protein